MKINKDNFVEEIKKKNPKALEFIVDEYVNLIFKVVKTVLNNNFANEYIEECVDDVFLAVWNNISSFKEDKGDFKWWIAAIAKYKAIDYIRKISKDSKLECIDEYNLYNEDEVEKVIIVKENKKELLKAINDMNIEDREIFIRRYFLYEGIEKIAQVFGVNRNWVDKRLSRGRKKLKEKLISVKGEVF